MNKGDLVSQVAENANLSKAEATEAVNAVLNGITNTLKGGGKTTIVGFGTFSTNDRPARTGRNPKTGEAIQIAAKTVVKFKPGKELASAVN